MTKIEPENATPKQAPTRWNVRYARLYTLIGANSVRSLTSQPSLRPLFVALKKIHGKAQIYAPQVANTIAKMVFSLRHRNLCCRLIPVIAGSWDLKPSMALTYC